ncbi:unnamed protein product [Darwinula stevensoni]|uniref:BTB domain-containing protein n=1 Tax=Darwinula stevensoni TaxID=69355 RepID=A0A7R8XFP5_9CRUS|nr:unnamed protein product [Darwinula stevensoni]CAG0895722.1 unnamed protein product [Darwinula stevensoni]
MPQSDLHEHCKDKESLIMRAPRSQKDIHMFIEALRSQRLMEDKCDVVILVGARRFPSHRCILEANCPMFKNMFQSGMKEVNQTEIRLESVDEMAFRAIWDYMYGIELIFEDQQLLPVLLAADYLQMEQVVDCISTAFEKSPTVENAAIAANSDIMAEPSNAQLILEASRYHIPSQRDLIVTQRTKPRLYQDRIWCFGEGPSDGQKVNVPLPPASLGLHARATATSSDAAYILGGFGIASNPRHSPIRSCSSNAARLDIAAQTWVSLPKMSTTRSHAVATIHNSVLYVVGGSGNSGLATASVERLDIRTKKWEELPRLPCGVAGAAVAIHNEKLFVTGGEELTWEDALHADTFMFDEGGARWIKLPSMTSPRKYHALVTWRSDLYAVGGMKNSTVETWDGHNWVQIHKFNGLLRRKFLQGGPFKSGPGITPSTTSFSNNLCCRLRVPSGSTFQ